jgi:hypothetical protein
MFKDLMREVR